MKNHTQLPLLNDGCALDFNQEELIKRLIEEPSFQSVISQHFMYSTNNQHDYKWWKGVIFIQQSWQLTALGLTYFSSHFKTFKKYNDANNMISANVILGLNEVISGPWLIRRHTIYTWNEDIYFELMMFEGNVHEFLRFKGQKNLLTG